MSCSNCYKCGKQVPLIPPVTNCVDCMPPAPECGNIEVCSEITYAECVEYRGEDLPKINVRTGDRLDAILRKLGINKGTRSIETEDTDTVHLRGNGLASDKLQADVQVDPDTDNAITVSDKGLLVKVDESFILNLFTIIHNSPDLHDKFCELLQLCAEKACHFSTDLSTEMS